MTEFHKNLPIGSEVGGGAFRQRQDGDFISLHFSFRKESGLKNQEQFLCLEDSISCCGI
jgi:hypothetical protein